MHVLNLLDENTGNFTSAAASGVGNWIGVDVALARTTRRYFTSPASMQATYTGSNGGTMTVYSGENATLTTVSNNVEYRAFAWVHHFTPGREFTFGVQMYDTLGSALPLTNPVTSFDYFITKTIGYGEWTLVSLQFITPENARSAAIFIELESIDTSTDDKRIWVDSCVFIEYSLPTSEELIQKMMRWIPEYILIEDEKQTNPQYPFLTFADVADGDLHTILEYITDFGFYDVGDPTKPEATSILVDPRGFPNNAIQPEWLWWLAGITGTNRRGVTDGSDGTTSWFYLEQEVLTWDEWDDQLNLASLGPTVTISQSERTDGVATITSATNHGLTAGDVISVDVPSDSTFDGYYEITEVNSVTEFSYSQTYFVTEISQSGTTTVTVTTARAHGLSSGDSVVISGSGIADFDGTRTVAASATATEFTFTIAGTATRISRFGYAYPSNTGSPVSGGTFDPASDLTWLFVEGGNAYPLTLNEAVAKFISTGASGVWAGTIEGIKRAARIPLIGYDGAAAIERVDGTMTVTTATIHDFSVAQDVEIYNSPIVNVNGRYSVDTIVDDFTFTIATAGEDVITRGDVTNKIVDVVKQFWNGLIDNIEIDASVVTINFVDRIPVFIVGNNITIAGTSNALLNATHSTAGITVSSDRYSLTFATALSNFGPESPASAKALVDTGCYYCFVVETLASQTTGPDAVIDFANFASPAGGVITHQYA
jgi:hypothetical protein